MGFMSPVFLAQNIKRLSLHRFKPLVISKRTKHNIVLTSDIVHIVLLGLEAIIAEIKVAALLIFFYHPYFR